MGAPGRTPTIPSGTLQAGQLIEETRTHAICAAYTGALVPSLSSLTIKELKAKRDLLEAEIVKLKEKEEKNQATIERLERDVEKITERTVQLLRRAVLSQCKVITGIVEKHLNIDPPEETRHMLQKMEFRLSQIEVAAVDGDLEMLVLLLHELESMNADYFVKMINELTQRMREAQERANKAVEAQLKAEEDAREARDRVAAAEAALEAAEERARTAEAEKEKAQAQVDKLVGQVHNLEQEVQQLQSELSSANLEIKKLGDELESSQMKLKVTEEEKEKLSGDKASLSIRVDTLEKDSQSQLAKIEALENAQHEQEIDSQKALNQSSSLKGMLEEKDKEIARLQAEIERLKAQLLEQSQAPPAAAVKASDVPKDDPEFLKKLFGQRGLWRAVSNNAELQDISEQACEYITNKYATEVVLTETTYDADKGDSTAAGRARTPTAALYPFQADVVHVPRCRQRGRGALTAFIKWGAHVADSQEKLAPHKDSDEPDDLNTYDDNVFTVTYSTALENKVPVGDDLPRAENTGHYHAANQNTHIEKTLSNGVREDIFPTTMPMLKRPNELPRVHGSISFFTDKAMLMARAEEYGETAEILERQLNDDMTLVAEGVGKTAQWIELQQVEDVERQVTEIRQPKPRPTPAVVTQSPSPVQ
ncbi:hypothetical protein CYMTET_25696, partial [Cymbomonas tetramitiformis]